MRATRLLSLQKRNALRHSETMRRLTVERIWHSRVLIAVISAGEDNPYGHPNRELIERLETAGVRILRTDGDGAVPILTDGSRLEVSCFVACSGAFGSTAPAQAQTARSREATRATTKNR
jgi:hypothetical protein